MSIFDMKPKELKFSKPPKFRPPVTNPPAKENEEEEINTMEKFTGLSLENFLKIFEYVKYTKKKWFSVQVIIQESSIIAHVYGTDDDFSSVTYIENIEFPLENDEDRYQWGWVGTKVWIEYEIFFNKNEIIALMKEDGFGYISNFNIYDQMGYSKLWVGGSFLADKLHRLAYNAHLLGMGINPYISAKPDPTMIYHLDDLRQNTDITDSLSMKAGDGMEMVNLDSNIITLYGGMYPITSKDKASITLYDLHDGSTVSVVEIIKSKPKDLVIKCLLRYRSLSD